VKRGVTLIESILALSLLSVLLIVLLNLFPSSMRAVRQAEERQAAHALASSLLEQQAALPFASLTPGPPRDLPPQTIDKVRFESTLEVFRVPDSEEKFLRGLRVVVLWGDQRVQQEVWVTSVRP
jgi:prepilin-type N-terminal cleavage/methylation domain-containing protein